MQKYRLLNPEADKKRKRDWYLANKEKVCFFRKRSRILKKYNLSLGELEELRKRQSYKCAICQLEKELKVDHNHQTNKVRALLCDTCNRALGMFYDNQTYLLSAVNYLKTHP